MYPRREGPGSGLIPYNLTVGLKLPTLLILKNYGPITLPLTDNVNIKYIKYWENSFPKKYKINTQNIKLIQQNTQNIKLNKKKKKYKKLKKIK